MVKVRFHLAKGENYMKWQVKDANGDVQYLEPEQVSIKMYGCKLINQRGTAEKIHEGENKTVCAWVRCERIEVTGDRPVDTGQKVSYNPKVLPYWVQDGRNVDKKEYDTLVTNNRHIFVTI